MFTSHQKKLIIRFSNFANFPYCIFRKVCMNKVSNVDFN